MVNVVVVASVRRDAEAEWVKRVIEKHSGEEVWLIVDGKSAGVLAKFNVLSRVRGDRVLVFTGKRAEEYALKAYKVTTPDIAYVCDKYGALRVIVDFLRVTPIKLVEC